MTGPNAHQSATHLLVVIGTGSADDPALADAGPFDATTSLEDLVASIRGGGLGAHLLRHGKVTALAEHLDALPRPFLLSALLRVVGRGPVELRDRHGARRTIGWTTPLWFAKDLIRDNLAQPFARREMERRLAELETLNAEGARLAIPRDGPVLMLRTDLWLGVRAGGAVAHTAGIANALAEHGLSPVLAAFESNPILAGGVRQRAITPPRRFWNVPEGTLRLSNVECEAEIERVLDEVAPKLLYHRLASFSFIGALAAKRRNLPLVVEYNGSEVWIARNWGRPLRSEALALRIETAVLAAADRIVTVSAPLTAELVTRGFAAEKIVTVPNGVDTARIHPAIDGSRARRRLGIGDDETVIAFIGSFGVWHGVGVLAEAFALLIARRPDLRTRLRLLLVGDGAERPRVEAILHNRSVADRAVLTGLVAQADALEYLAAGDILAAPHVSPGDTPEFFGSPTKIFEYMALGRCIVASRLGQIGEVLTDGATALLAEPGDVSGLATALERAVNDPELRRSLALSAREEAVRHHGWVRRVSSILPDPASP